MIIQNVFSKKQRMIAISIKELNKMFEAGNITIRETNQAHVRRIKDYMLENALDNNIYFPPLVATLPNSEIELENPKYIQIIDGSHRLKAIIQVNELIQKAIKNENAEMIKKGYKLLSIIDQTSIAIQLIGELSIEESNQLYIDLNTKGKKVSLSKRISYDSRNILNRITNIILATNHTLQIAGVEMEKRSMIRPANKKLLSLSQLRQLVNIFISGSMLLTKQTLDSVQQLKEEEYIDLVNIWLDELFILYSPNNIGNDHDSIFANFPILVSMALYVNKGQQNSSFEQRKLAIQRRMKAVSKLDWNRHNENWLQFSGSRRGKQNYYYIDYKKATIMRIIEWLESEGR
ncbi:DNA sulfur modification protein DndB [Bacillus sp. JJ722]|uniref:DNA sulfur modification protein DndB n=1 Tax=Bacillus sp. JJ722 TaxID=3122973 RepID=UPI002FFF088D